MHTHSYPPGENPKHMFDDLSVDQKERLSKVVMAFEEDICPEGRRRFLAHYGFPTPPISGTGILYIQWDVPPEALNASGYLTAEGTADIKHKIEQALLTVGVRMDPNNLSEFDYEED